MNEATLKTFNAISGFLNDLNSCFSNVKSIELFNRLIEKTTFRDNKAIERYITAFRTFFMRNPKFITEKVIEVPRIVYTDRIYIDIAWVIKNSGVNRDVIYKHMLTIYTLMNTGTKEAVESLQILKDVAVVPTTTPTPVIDIPLPDTNEGRFIKESIEGVGKLASELNLESSNNVGEMIATVMQSDFFVNFAQNLNSKFAKGELDVNSLIRTVGTVVTDGGLELGDEVMGLLSTVVPTVVPAVTDMPPDLPPTLD